MSKGSIFNMLILQDKKAILHVTRYPGRDLNGYAKGIIQYKHPINSIFMYMYFL